MSETDLKVIVKAKELAFHSLKLTSNCNRYPKKYRHSLVDRIQLKSLDMDKKIKGEFSEERASQNHAGR